MTDQFASFTVQLVGGPRDGEILEIQADRDMAGPPPTLRYAVQPPIEVLYAGDPFPTVIDTHEELVYRHRAHVGRYAVYDHVP